VKLSELYQLADAIAPKSLSDEFCANYHSYDNSGILVDTGDEVKKVLFSLDLSNAAIEEAVNVGANVIVTHHPAIFGSINHISAQEFNPLGEKLVKCIRKGISVISMHLNLDCAEGGIDESLQEGITTATGGEKTSAALMNVLSVGGYGRAYDVKECTLAQLKESMEKEFSTSRIHLYGKENAIVRRVASFCGGGADEKAVEFAVAQGADVMISSDFKHHILTLANERGIAVLTLTHYASEYYGFKKYYEKISQSANVPCVLHTDVELL
jgi:dinuclear metal center YbgI/SA1388 family protein